MKRMLASRHPAARSALGREALRYPLIPVDRVMGLFERRRLQSAGDPELPIVLVVGLPRSGTTLLGQVLTAHLPVSFPSNLTELFPHAPITATHRLGRFARRRVRYETFYGNTASLGSPNDAFSIWNRWLGADRYHTPSQLDPATGAQMRRFFGAWELAMGRPFLNKNNRNTAAMGALAEHLPTARFVVIRRDPLFVAQSLVEARQVVQGDRRVGWGLGAEGVAGDDDYITDVADQVKRVEQTLDEQLARLPAGVTRQVTYAALCADPAGLVRDVAGWLGVVPADTAGLEPFAVADRPRLEPAEFDRLTEEIGRRFSSG
ncbi:MAG: sulfotransferase [Acidimicrobiia bacterium]|nr:sulfotransferase [Acidimicrobiia bacterium]